MKAKDNFMTWAMTSEAFECAKAITAKWNAGEMLSVEATTCFAEGWASTAIPNLRDLSERDQFTMTAQFVRVVWTNVYAPSLATCDEEGCDGVAIVAMILKTTKKAFACAQHHPRRDGDDNWREQFAYVVEGPDVHSFR